MRSKLTKPSSSRSNGFFANSGKKSSDGIQAKLKTNKPGDQYEVEADKTADHVVGQSMGSILSGKSLSPGPDRKSTRLNSSHVRISYAVFCLKKKTKKKKSTLPHTIPYV